jgi:hypothetical protein
MQRPRTYITVQYVMCCVEDHALAPARLPDQGEDKPIEE